MLVIRTPTLPCHSTKDEVLEGVLSELDNKIDEYIDTWTEYPGTTFYKSFITQVYKEAYQAGYKAHQKIKKT